MKTKILQTGARAFLLGWAFLLFGMFSAQGINISISGPVVVCPNQVIDYSLTFLKVVDYAVPVSAKITIYNGVFMPSGTTELTVGPGITNFQVRWNTKGTIYVLYSYKTMYTPVLSYGSLNQAVEMSVFSDIPILNRNMPEGSHYDVHSKYEVYTNASGMDYEWSINGVADIISSINSNSITIQTQGTAGTLVVSVRSKNCSGWSAWYSKTIYVTPILPVLSLSFSGDPNNVLPNTTYTASSTTASNAVNFEWAVTGDISIINKIGGEITFKTGTAFSSGSIQVRGKNSLEWSEWKSITLNFDCSTPTGVTIKGDYDDDHEYDDDKSYKFFATATNAKDYEWAIFEGQQDAKINANSSGNMLDLKLKLNFTKIIIRVRAKKNCNWSQWVYYEIKPNIFNPNPCTEAPPTNVYITTSLDNQTLCNPASGSATIHANGASGYSWFIQNGCMTSFGFDCTTQSGGPWANTSTNFTMSASPVGSYFSTEIVVYVFYCNGAKYVRASKVISGNKLNCSGGRVSISEVAQPIKGSGIYPNPVKAGESLQLSSEDLIGVTQISIFDKFGKVVKQINKIAGNGFEISTEGYSSGLYIIKVICKNQVKEYKVYVE